MKVDVTKFHAPLTGFLRTRSLVSNCRLIISSKGFDISASIIFGHRLLLGTKEYIIFRDTIQV